MFSKNSSRKDNHGDDDDDDDTNDVNDDDEDNSADGGDVDGDEVKIKISFLNFDFDAFSAGQLKRTPAIVQSNYFDPIKNYDQSWRFFFKTLFFAAKIDFFFVFSSYEVRQIAGASEKRVDDETQKDSDDPEIEPDVAD